MVENRTNWMGRQVSIQANFKLSRSVLTVIFDIAGHEEWLRLRQVCRLFDDASYSMAKKWPADARLTLEQLVEEEQKIMASDGLQELIDSIRAEIDEKYNAVVTLHWVKDRIIRWI